MERLSERMVESALLALVIVSGAMLSHGVAYCEDAGCTNNMCKNISYYYACEGKDGIALDNSDCLNCATVGRCVNPKNDTCKEPEGAPVLKFALTTVTNSCDCANIQGNKPTVEATGNYKGDYNNKFNRNRMTCGGS